MTNYSMVSEIQALKGGRGREGGVRKKTRREGKRRGDCGEKEGNACYNNPIL